MTPCAIRGAETPSGFLQTSILARPSHRPTPRDHGIFIAAISSSLFGCGSNRMRLALSQSARTSRAPDRVSDDQPRSAVLYLLVHAANLA